MKEQRQSAIIGMIVLAAGLSLVFATKLRFPGLPVGPGEMLLVVWFVVTAAAALRDGTTVSWSAARPLLKFWLVAFLALGIGTLNGMVQDKASPPGTALHDTAAYLFCAGLSVLFAARFGASNRAPNHDERFSFVLALALAAPLAVLWVIAQSNERLFGYELWYSFRFIAWATNPNQTALVLLLVPFLFFHYLERIGPSIPRLLIILIPCGLAEIAGWASASSALRLAWTICLPLLLIAPLLTGGRPPRKDARVLALGGGLALAILISGNLLIGLESRAINPEPKVASANVTTQVERVFIKSQTSKEKIDARTTLLINAGKVIVASHGLGYGPGSFSGIDGPFGGSEAHNLLLDWGMSGGVLGMAALLTLLGAIAWRLWRARHFVLLSGLLALLVFAQFHHVLRHPLVWIFLAHAWLEGEDSGRRAGHPRP